MRRFLLPLFALLPVLFITSYVTGCATSGAIIPEGLSPAELIQRAQEARDKNRYGIAMQYYRVLLERNINNLYLVCEAEYEIAFIQYKQKKFIPARAGFNALLERYASPEREYLPPQFEILAYKVLENITEKENRRKPFSRKPKNSE